jgi:hypothetical protein
MAKVFQKTIQAMQMMSQAYQLLSESWDEAMDEGILHLLDGEITAIVNQTNQDASKKSYDEAVALIDANLEDIQAVQVRMNDLFVENLWEQLGDVAWADSDNHNSLTDIVLDENFYIWRKGTDKGIIDKWFDENYSKGLSRLLDYGDELSWKKSKNNVVNGYGLLRYVNNDFEIYENKDDNKWTLVYLSNEEYVWHRKGNNKAKIMKAIADGFMANRAVS